jgi:hypothetical protein
VAERRDNKSRGVVVRKERVERKRQRLRRRSFDKDRKEGKRTLLFRDKERVFGSLGKLKCKMKSIEKPCEPQTDFRFCSERCQPHHCVDDDDKTEKPKEEYVENEICFKKKMYRLGL